MYVCEKGYRVLGYMIGYFDERPNEMDDFIRKFVPKEDQVAVRDLLNLY